FSSSTIKSIGLLMASQTKTIPAQCATGKASAVAAVAADVRRRNPNLNVPGQVVGSPSLRFCPARTLRRRSLPHGEALVYGVAMRLVRVSLGERSYSILIGNGLVRRLGAECDKLE